MYKKSSGTIILPYSYTSIIMRLTFIIQQSG